MPRQRWTWAIVLLAACAETAPAPPLAPPEVVPGPPPGTVMVTSHWRVRVVDSLSLTVACFGGGLGERTAVEGSYALLSRDSVIAPDVVQRDYYFEGSEVRQGLVSGEVWTSGGIRSPYFVPYVDWDGSLAHFYRTAVPYRNEAGALVVIHWLFTLRWGTGREPEIGTKVRYCELVE